jgi:hypothetical protein
MNIAETRHTVVETWGSAWSEPDEKRRLELLGRAAAPTCTYMDPNTELTGHVAISGYMAGFQESAPGARFVTTGFRGTTIAAACSGTWWTAMARCFHPASAPACSMSRADFCRWWASSMPDHRS